MLAGIFVIPARGLGAGVYCSLDSSSAITSTKLFVNSTESWVSGTFAGLISAAITWVSKVRTEWNYPAVYKSRKKQEDPRTAEAEVTTQTAGLAIDEAGRDQDLAVQASYDPNLPINRLPTELLLYIFHCDTPGAKHPLTLTHVCQRWRMITIASGSLWTSVIINISLLRNDQSFRKFFSLLDLQLERTQNRPLDVIWHVRGSSYRARVTMDHIRRKGPFHRWRSLTLFLDSVYTHTFLPTDSFANLESLKILSGHAHQILETINLTTTSKLRTLHIRLSRTGDEDIGRLYGEMLKRVTHLVLPGTDTGTTVDRLPSIPPNVTDIATERKWNHPFPHVKRYKLTHGTFGAASTFDLKSLTSLLVTSSLDVQNDCHLVLPLLSRFVCAHITLGKTAVLEAPQLAELEFRYDQVTVSKSPRGRFGYIKDILDHPGFLLSPTKSLVLELSLPPDLITTMLTRYSRLEKLELRFNDDMTVWKVTVAIGGKASGSDAICPRLTELRVRFTKEYRGMRQIEWWKDRAAQIVQGRKGWAAALCIYGTWYEGETFILLA